MLKAIPCAKVANTMDAVPHSRYLMRLGDLRLRSRESESTALDRLNLHESLRNVPPVREALPVLQQHWDRIAVPGLPDLDPCKSSTDGLSLCD